MPPKGGVGDFINARVLHKQQSNPQAVPRSGTPPSKAPFKPETREQMANLSSNERRKLIAENARIEIPNAKIAYSDIRVPSIKPKGKNEIVLEASQVSTTDVIHQDSQNHFYDTDVGNLDDTSTLSNGLQAEQSQTNENGHEFAESHFFRKWDGQGTQAPDTLLSQDQDLLYNQGYQDEEYHIEGYDEDNEDVTDEDASSSEGYPVEDEPTMDSVKLNSAIRSGLVHPSEAGVFNKFVKNGLPFSPLSDGRLQIENQAFQLNGTTTPYPSTRSSETSLIPFPSAVGIFQNQQGPSQTLEYQNHSQSKASHHTPKKQRDNLSSQRHEMSGRKHKKQQDNTNRRNSQTQERDISQPILPERLLSVTSTALTDPPTQEPLPNNPSSPEAIVDDPRPPPINIPSNNPETQMPISSKRPLELDYLPSDLSKLPYSTLQSQPFEIDPHRPPTQLPSHITTAPLPEKLSYMSSLPSNDRHHPQNLSTPNLTTFLSSLPVDQYEECGDLIIEQFSTILNKFKDMRRKKREVARAFEEEIASREADVRERREGVENEVGRLGSGVREVVMRRR